MFENFPLFWKIYLATTIPMLVLIFWVIRGDASFSRSDRFTVYATCALPFGSIVLILVIVAHFLVWAAKRAGQTLKRLRSTRKTQLSD